MKLSYEYIRGLVEGEGCFTFCTVGRSEELRKPRIPTFVISMSRRDKDLLLSVKETLSLKNKVYEYKPRIAKDSYNRQGMAVLMVRDFGQLKNIIVPLFYKKLNGNKRKQFEEWIEEIGTDKNVPGLYKFIYKLCKWGYYDKNSKYS